MTDEERLQQIYAIAHGWEHSRRGGSSLAHDRLTLSRIRTLLDDVPSVEWDENAHASVGRMKGGGRLIVLTNETGLWSCRAWLGDERSTTADAWRLPSRDSAKARAVALYAALRGVT